MPKPILILSSGLTGIIYAVRRYSEREGGIVAGTSPDSKEDVTESAIIAVEEHLRVCHRADCRCKKLIDNVLPVVNVLGPGR